MARNLRLASNTRISTLGRGTFDSPRASYSGPNSQPKLRARMKEWNRQILFDDDSRPQKGSQSRGFRHTCESQFPPEVQKTHSALYALFLKYGHGEHGNQYLEAELTQPQPRGHPSRI